MQKPILCACLLLLGNFYSLGQSLSKKQQVRLMYSLIETHNPPVYEMLTTLAKLPSKYKINQMTITTGKITKPEKWLRGSTAEDIRGSLKTVVHESIHSFTSYYSYQFLTSNAPDNFKFGDDYSAFFIDQNNTLIVKHTEVYNSNELKRDIPKALRTFRYSPYIAPKTNLGSQKQGVYGLLDEFNAYYQGTLMSFKLFPIYEELGQDNPRAYQDYLQNMSSIRMAFYEFKYYLLTYLNRAKTDYPEQYESFLQNTNLRKAYTLVHDRYEELLENINQRITNLIDRLNKEGIASYIEDDYFWVQNHGIGMNLDDIALLESELSKQLYTDLHGGFILN